MKSTVKTYDWKRSIEDIATKENRIGEDLVLFDDYDITSDVLEPFIVEDTTALLCMEGEMTVCMNMQEYKVEAPSMMILLGGQVMQYKQSDAAKPKVRGIIMSRRFMDNLFMSERERTPLFQSFFKNPVWKLNEGDMMAINRYYSMLENNVRNIANPYRLETAKYLTLAMFYGYGYTHEAELQEASVYREGVYERFVELLRRHHRQERSGSFYADKIGMSTKYLSQQLKQQTGRTLGEWIEQAVCTTAKAMLLSGKMTVQEVAYELHFDDQSLFGKYFARVVGMSPLAYRKSVK